MTENFPIEPSDEIEPILNGANKLLPYPIPPRTLGWYGILFGTAMIALAVLWALVWRGDHVTNWFPSRRWLADILLGGGVGLAFALAAWRLIDYVPALKQLEHIIMHTLDMEPLRPLHAVWFGLIAGIPEEILFRGAMQPVLGLVVTSIIFGALHAVTRAYFVYALVASLMLGALAHWTPGLWAPIAAHVMIDTVMFWLLIARWRHYHLPDRPQLM